MLNFMIMMNINNKNTNLLGVTLIILCVLSSCIPIIDSRVDAIFKNSTNDTLFIGASHYDNLDPDPFYDSRAGRNRQYIRIHPARSNGTNGCIGLRANKAQLIRARDLIRKSLNKGLTIKLYVQIGVN